MASNGKDMTCFRLAPEVRAAVDQLCLANGISLSDFYRDLTGSVLSGQIELGASAGYRAAKAMALQLASVLLAQAAAMMPETLEEAVARFELTTS